MNITIEQRKFSFRSEYDISAPGFIYYAQKKAFSFSDKIQVLSESRGVLAKIRSRFSFFKMKYDFELANGKIYHFWCEKLWKCVFVCESSEERFRLYEHKGLNYSIFQNDAQIAAFTKNRVKIGNGDRYEIRVNDDANVIIVICLVLTVDAAENENDRATVTVDVGNIGPEDRPFDESWEPS